MALFKCRLKSAHLPTEGQKSWKLQQPTIEDAMDCASFVKEFVTYFCKRNVHYKHSVEIVPSGNIFYVSVVINRGTK